MYSSLFSGYSRQRLIKEYKRALLAYLSSDRTGGAFLTYQTILSTLVEELKQHGLDQPTLRSLSAQALRTHERALRRQAREPAEHDFAATFAAALKRQGWDRSTARRLLVVAQLAAARAGPAGWPRRISPEDRLYQEFARRPMATFEFHPVGQGLFSSGHVATADRSRHLSWAYDCGTSSGRQLIDVALTRLTDSIGTEQMIDLVVLSHFDSDHISGLAKLLSTAKIRMLLIPHVPLWQRLLVLFSPGTYVAQSEQRALLDPLGTIRSLAGDRVETIVLIPPSRGEAMPPRSGVGPDPGPDIRPPSDAAKNDPNERAEQVPARSTRAPILHDGVRVQSGPPDGPGVYELPSGGILRVPGDWEFVPYNDAKSASRPDAAFIALAEHHRDALLGAAGATARRDALRALKRHYEARYRNAKARNDISLFLYAGPEVWRPVTQGCRNRLVETVAPGNSRYQHLALAYPGHARAALYCGDGNLSSADSWNRLRTYLGPERSGNLLVVQVMHHGASKSWHKGLAQAMSASVAVFAADPDRSRPGHPHRVVASDFSRHGLPILVNRLGLSLSATW